MKFDCIEKIIKSVFRRYGRFLARHPLPFLVLSVLVAAVLAAGLYFLDTESTIEDLYIPEDARAKTERAYVQKHFPKNDSNSFQATRLTTFGRPTSVIITSKLPDDSVLGTMALAAIDAFNKAVKGIQAEVSGKNYSYEDLCSKWNTQCQISGEDLLNFAIQKNESTAISYPRTDVPGGFPVSTAGTLGSPVLKAGSEEVEEAKSFRLNYHLRTDSPADDKLSEKWELEALSFMETFKSSVINVYYSTPESLDEELAALTPRVIPLFTITFTVLITFSFSSRSDRDLALKTTVVSD